MDNIEIYTDGSCHTQFKTGGWAAIVIYEGEESILEGIEQDTTHNRMELTAVLKSLEYIAEKQFSYEMINIFTDSQYVVQIEKRKEKLKAKEFRTKSGKDIQNKDLVFDLIDLIESLPVNFIKVKAHLKKTGLRNINREVDKLSRKIVRDYIRGR